MKEYVETSHVAAYMISATTSGLIALEKHKRHYCNHNGAQNGANGDSSDVAAGQSFRGTAGVSV
jgi:hypothetical protein